MNSAVERSRNLRYKKSALASMGYENITEELYEIQDACGEIHWFVDQGDETLLNALDGDEDQTWEFKMVFGDIEAKVDQLLGKFQEADLSEVFDTCTVALIGNRYRLVGFDAMEEDYFSLCSFEQGLATSEAGKRLMRYTKAEMIMLIGQCFGMLMAYLDLRQQYDYIKATYDILRNENTSLLLLVKDISNAYEQADDAAFASGDPATKTFDRLLQELPQRMWIE